MPLPHRRRCHSADQCANADGDMVPLGAVAAVRDSPDRAQVVRYNCSPRAINRASLPGVSSGDVIKMMEGLREPRVPQNMTTSGPT